MLTLGPMRRAGILDGSLAKKVIRCCHARMLRGAHAVSTSQGTRKLDEEVGRALVCDGVSGKRLAMTHCVVSTRKRNRPGLDLDMMRGLRFALVRCGRAHEEQINRWRSGLYHTEKLHPIIWIRDYGLRTTDYGLRTTNYQSSVCWRCRIAPSRPKRARRRGFGHVVITAGDVGACLSRADAQTRRRAGDVIGDDRQGSVAATVSTILHLRPGNSTSHWLVHLELHRNAASPPPARQCTAATCRPTRPTRAIGTLPNADATQDGISQPLCKLPASCVFLRLQRLTSQPFWPGWSTMQFAMAGRTRALFSGGGEGGEKTRKEGRKRLTVRL